MKLNYKPMFYSEKITNKAANNALVEARHKITIEQKERIKDLEERLNIPASILVRMALDSFLPKIKIVDLQRWV